MVRSRGEAETLPPVGGNAPSSCNAQWPFCKHSHKRGQHCSFTAMPSRLRGVGVEWKAGGITEEPGAGRRQEGWIQLQWHMSDPSVSELFTPFISLDLQYTTKGSGVCPRRPKHGEGYKCFVFTSLSGRPPHCLDVACAHLAWLYLHCCLEIGLGPKDNRCG